jgi:hypothetical protein
VEHNALLVHGCGQGFRQIRIEKRKKRIPAIDQMDSCSERSEHTSVLAADHTSANDGQRPRHGGYEQQFVGIVDSIVFEGELTRSAWCRTDGNHNLVG